MNRLTPYKNTLLILAAFLLVVLTARIEILHIFSFLALLPIPFLLQNANARKATMLVTLCATLFWIGTCYWLVPANINFSHSNTLVITCIFLLFCLWQALPYTVTAFCYSRFSWQTTAAGPLLAAACLTVAWSLIPSPLPWLPVNSLYDFPKFVAVLDLSGMSLLLFLSALYCFAIEYLSRGNVQYKKHYFSSLFIIPVLMLVYGEYQQTQLEQAKQQAKPEQWLHIGYIQPNLKFEQPFDYTYLLTEQLILEKKPDLIVWPEISSPFSIDNSAKDRANAFRLVNKYQQDLITVSGYIFTNEYIGERQKYFNQAQFINEQGIQGRYSKEILVPFFEYLPKPLEFLRRWMPNVLVYQAGENQQAITYKAHIQFAMAICYEVIFPNYVRKQIQSGANILINPSSDAAFGGGIGGYYHLVTAYFRTIENRVPWVRATNTGISVIVDADGKPLTPMSQNNTATLDSAKVFIPEQTSLYSRAGNWFAILAFIAILLYQSAVFIKKRG